jgi:hypothetical protein
MADPEILPPTAGDQTAPRVETGSYILRSLIKDVALSANDDGNDVKITCVEVWS